MSDVNVDQTRWFDSNKIWTFNGKSFLIYAAVYIEFLINCDMGEHTTIHIFFFNSEIKKKSNKKWMHAE